MKIKFGTDGWRAIIARDFTYKNLNIVSQATARWISETNVSDQGVVIGFDTRFQGRQFAEHAAAVFCEMDIPVKLADSICTTPAVSLAAKIYEYVGIVITASHNPPEYNGFKIKAPFGGPATPEQIGEVEKHLDGFDSSLDPGPIEQYIDRGELEIVNLTDQFNDRITSSIDLDAIRKSNIHIAHDPMFGAAQGIIRRILGEEQVLEIHGERNPGFNGQAPEPIEKNLVELSKTVPKHDCAVGLANDGDGDRIGMLDENGEFVSSHKLLSLLVKYLHQEKGMSGDIIKTFSTTNMLNKQAEKYGLNIETTPIGFKYIADKMIGGDVLVGGEESGGLAVKGHIPERDGIYIGLLITEMIVKSGKKLSRLVQELFEEFGPHYFYRNDLHTSDDNKLAMMDHCQQQKLTEIAGHRVKEWEFIDGVKHILEDESWLLVRPSGTEPVLRIYAEASTKKQAEELVREVSELTESGNL